MSELNVTKWNCCHTTLHLFENFGVGKSKIKKKSVLAEILINASSYYTYLCRLITFMGSVTCLFSRPTFIIKWAMILLRYIWIVFMPKRLKLRNCNFDIISLLFFKLYDLFKSNRPVKWGIANGRIFPGGWVIAGRVCYQCNGATQSIFFFLFIFKKL